MNADATTGLVHRYNRWRWARRPGSDAARRLVETEDLAKAVTQAITPDNTLNGAAGEGRSLRG